MPGGSSAEKTARMPSTRLPQRVRHCPEVVVSADTDSCTAAILAGTDAAGAGAGVEEALNCWEEGAYEAETLETLAEFGD